MMIKQGESMQKSKTTGKADEFRKSTKVDKIDNNNKVDRIDKARTAAVNVVYEVNVNNAYANIALAKELRTNKLNDLDRRFATELIYGTLKLGDSLDWIISQYISRPLDKIDEKILAILRVGMYQIFFLDRVPNFAAINESVEMAKKINIGSSKFVNAVMRSAVREPDKSKFPDDDSVESVALRLFHPKWLIERWFKQFGIDETKKICAADNSEPPLTIRVNTLKTSKAELISELEKVGAEVVQSKLINEGLICKNLGALDNLSLLKNGLCQVQDESSMLVTQALNPQPGDCVIDACAAPGGKATHIAELMNNQGKIIACDIHEHKIKLINDNARRLGINIINAKLLDARQIGNKFADTADKVLVDAPCSGLGVLRRKADLRWKKNFDELKALPNLQFEILSSAANAVKTGGTLVYSTCTLECAENEEVIKKFLTANNNFELIEQKTLLPQIDGNDGFFIAVMNRK